MKNEIKCSWMDWVDILPYKNQLAELEVTLMLEYHYPGYPLQSAQKYCMAKVDELEQHLKNGNTYFWGMCSGEKLIGYYWAYMSPFLERMRWNIRSIMIRREYQHSGLGSLALMEGIKKARELGCTDSATMYVPWNTSAAAAYEKAGYKISRVEIVRELKDAAVNNDQRSEIIGGGYLSYRQITTCRRREARPVQASRGVRFMRDHKWITRRIPVLNKEMNRSDS